MEGDTLFMKMIKGLLMVSALLLTGCSGSKPDYVGVTDGQGRQVTFDANKVSRVVCIGAGALRFYSYIGDVKNVIAVEEIDSSTTFGVGDALRPYYLANKDSFGLLPLIGKGGPMAQVADKEKIVAANPDIIVSFLSKDANDELERDTKIPVIGLSQGPQGVYDETTQKSFQVLGTVFKKDDRATSLINYIEDSKESFKNLTETTETYYAGCIGNWGKTNLYGTFNNWPVFNMAKVKPAIKSLDITDKGQITIDAEKLTKINPDKIFVDTAGIAGFLSDYKQNPTKYDALKAFSTGETYQVMPYNAYYTNLEIQLMSTYYVASIAHPESFENFSIEDKCNEISEKFLGKQLYNDMKAHPNGMGGYKKINVKDLIGE